METYIKQTTTKFGSLRSIDIMSTSYTEVASSTIALAKKKAAYIIAKNKFDQAPASFSKDALSKLREGLEKAEDDVNAAEAAEAANLAAENLPNITIKSENHTSFLMAMLVKTAGPEQYIDKTLYQGFYINHSINILKQFLKDIQGNTLANVQDHPLEYHTLSDLQIWQDAATTTNSDIFTTLLLFPKDDNPKYTGLDANIKQSIMYKKLNSYVQDKSKLTKFNMVGAISPILIKQEGTTQTLEYMKSLLRSTDRCEEATHPWGSFYTIFLPGNTNEEFYHGYPLSEHTGGGLSPKPNSITRQSFELFKQRLHFHLNHNMTYQEAIIKTHKYLYNKLKKIKDKKVKKIYKDAYYLYYNMYHKLKFKTSQDSIILHNKLKQLLTNQLLTNQLRISSS